MTVLNLFEGKKILGILKLELVIKFTLVFKHGTSKNLNTSNTPFRLYYYIIGGKQSLFALGVICKNDRSKKEN